MNENLQKNKSISKKQSWDKSWEKVFQMNEWGKYPPEELIRFMGRNFYKKNRKQVKVLDLGCGTGACSWYVAREGFSVYGVDGSKTAINLAKKRFFQENLKGNFFQMDYINLKFADEFFDLIIDINSIQHNKISKIPEIVEEINRVLKPGGYFFSILISTKTTKNKNLENKGHIHYFKLNETRKLFKNLGIKNIEKSFRTENNRKNKIYHWILTCEKL